MSFSDLLDAETAGVEFGGPRLSFALNRCSRDTQMKISYYWMVVPFEINVYSSFDTQIQKIIPKFTADRDLIDLMRCRNPTDLPPLYRKLLLVSYGVQLRCPLTYIGIFQFRSCQKPAHRSRERDTGTAHATIFLFRIKSQCPKRVKNTLQNYKSPQTIFCPLMVSIYDHVSLSVTPEQSTIEQISQWDVFWGLDFQPLLRICVTDSQTMKLF